MLYDKLYALLEPQVPVPDLVLYLVADVAHLHGSASSAASGRSEKSLSEEYLKELIDAYHHYYHYYTDSPLLVVDTREMNVAAGKR
jgi:deoxyguanosine kinase